MTLGVFPMLMTSLFVMLNCSFLEFLDLFCSCTLINLVLMSFVYTLVSYLYNFLDNYIFFISKKL